MEKVDVLVIGAGFAGLTFGHHLPTNYRVVILDGKSRLDSAIESTGLITQATKDLISVFVKIDNFIPNAIDTIGVVSPDYNKYFFSHTPEPWIYSTDTPNLVKHLSITLPKNVELRTGTRLTNYFINESHEYPVTAEYQKADGQKGIINAKFIVGADGAESRVAKLHASLSKNNNFLVGYEKVFFGEIKFGERPQSTVYHFWFGEFSLGYGGWLSPTIIGGQSAFRLGLAKLKKNINEVHKIDQFIEILQSKGIIKIDDNESKCVQSFGHLIPIGGVLPKISTPNVLLVGDAAGFCGAFAADGIKGAVLSGKVGANLVHQYLQGDKRALKKMKVEMEKNSKMITYYQKQVMQRKIWNIMKKDRTFHAMYNVIACEKNDFLNQFCDNKDKGKSLVGVVLKIKNIPLLAQYAWYLLLDLLTI